MTDTPRTTLGYVLKGYPRISETFISNEIRLMEELGYRIHIFSMRAPRENFSHDSIRHIRAKVTYLPESLLRGLPRLLWRNLLLLIAHPRRYLRGLRLLLDRFPLAPKKHTWLKHFLQAGYLVQKDAYRLGVAHFHAHFAHTPTSVALYAALLGDTSFSFFAHAKDIYTQKPRALAQKLALACFSVTCTAYNQKYLQKLAPEGKPVHCVYHGIDLSLFDPAGRATEAKPPYTIMTVARFVPKKGLDTILRALAILRDQNVPFKYVLAGDGPLKDAVLQDIQALGLAEHVQLPGTIAHTEVLELYRQAHAFTLASREAEDGDRDGIPNVIAESMAMAVPVAATTVSGIPELIENERSGLLVPPNDPEALAQALTRLLTDNTLRATLLPAARQRVTDIFDNRTQAQRLAAIYTEHHIPRPGA